jgi:hypothetical protein
MTTKKSILVIGFDPRSVSFTPEQAAAGVTEEKILAGIRAQDQRIREAGFDLTQCHVTPDNALAMATASLQSGHYDVIIFGAGVRTRPDSLHLFEKLVNLVHEHAPRSRIAFTTGPVDALEAAQRWL